MTARAARTQLIRPWLVAVIAASLSLGSARPALAADDDEEVADARLTGYDPPVVNVGGGVAMSYAIVAFLAVISVGMTFKNARRTHLD